MKPSGDNSEKKEFQYTQAEKEISEELGAGLDSVQRTQTISEGGGKITKPWKQTKEFIRYI